LVGEVIPDQQLDSITTNENNTPIELYNEAFLASPSSTTNNPHNSTQVTEQSEASENNGLDTSMFNGDNVEILSPLFSSIFDEQLFLNTLNSL
jgi:hypothetical protein